MNILLWVLQVVLGLYYLMGGGWMLSKVPAGWSKIMPKPAWQAVGLLQILFALGLVLPELIGMSPQIISISAIGLAAETGLVGILTKPKFQGALWIVIPAVLALFVAYERMPQRPF